MNIVVLIVGVLATMAGLLVVRNYKAVWNFFSERRRELFGDRSGSNRFSRPETMRVVGFGWVALGVLVVLVGLLHK